MEDELDTKPNEGKEAVSQGIYIRYFKAIWRNVLFFSLMDIVSAIFVILITYILVRIIFLFLGSIIGVTVRQINMAGSILALIYVFSILVTSWWRHISLIRSQIRSQHSVKGSSHPGKTPEI